ncbi:MAG TPA: ribonuclease D [Rhodanobacteraceae bacterium]|nr:ribonuclease D [Rhodanobacteraceae bacterium]
MTEWIDRDESLLRLLESASDVLGLDTEFMRVDTFVPKLALLQLAADGHIALIDPLGGIDCAPLARVLANARRCCVMHSAGEDLEALATILPNGPGRLFDTQIAAAFAGLGAGLGYQKLVRELTGVELAKAETRSDWLRRPLTPNQLDYAAQDVIHLPVLHAGLSVRLDQRGYSDWLAEDCARMVERAAHREPDSEPQIALSGAAGWPRERQALLRRVLRWRDRAARTLNRPRPWILDDAHALGLVARPPADGNELFERSKGLRALRGAQRAELLDTLRAPLAPEELEFAPIPGALTAADKRALAPLREFVAGRATELDLPPGLLCARRHLEALLMTGRWPTALDGWRRGILHDGLMARVAEAGQAGSQA